VGGEGEESVEGGILITPRAHERVEKKGMVGAFKNRLLIEQRRGLISRAGERKVLVSENIEIG